MTKVQLTNFLDGANTAVSPFLQPQTSLTVSNGVNAAYELGALLKDTGYQIIGSQIQDNKSVKSLFNFRQSSSVQKMLATVDDATSDDTQLFYSTGGTWTEIGAAETAWANFAGMNVEMVGFIGYCFFVGHGTTDGFLPVGSLTGTTFSTSTNVTSMPQGKYIKRYRDRLYVFNSYISPTAYPYRCYFSSVPSAGAITWTPASDFFDVDFEDEGTGLGEVADRLVLFTDSSAYMYDQASKFKVWDIGGYHRTIQNHGPFIIFANSDGVWMSSGGQPQNISGNVINFFKGGNPANWLSSLVDEEYYIYVGTVTVKGVTYANCLMTFNIPLQQWRSRELADPLTSMAKYTTSGQRFLWMGDNDGKVYQKGKYTDSPLIKTDNGSPITANFETAPIFIGGLSLESDLLRLTAYANKALGLKLQGRILDNSQRILTEYKPIGELTKYINDFDVDIGSGVFIQIAGSEYGSNEYFSFYGLELDIKVNSEVNKS